MDNTQHTDSTPQPPLFAMRFAVPMAGPPVDLGRLVFDEETQSLVQPDEAQPRKERPLTEEDLLRIRGGWTATGTIQFITADLPAEYQCATQDPARIRLDHDS